MLEDPAYSSVVRWGNEGDSFVVLEVRMPALRRRLTHRPGRAHDLIVSLTICRHQNEKFTKPILPKHFKHSNFATFVRQLNKYDFHKVRQNEENGPSPYGPNVRAPTARRRPVALHSLMAH